jgi:hypothetical protein
LHVFCVCISSRILASSIAPGITVLAEKIALH